MSRVAFDCKLNASQYQSVKPSKHYTLGDSTAATGRNLKIQPEPDVSAAKTKLVIFSSKPLNLSSVTTYQDSVIQSAISNKVLLIFEGQNVTAATFVSVTLCTCTCMHPCNALMHQVQYTMGHGIN